MLGSIVRIQLVNLSYKKGFSILGLTKTGSLFDWF